ncbi:MAG: 3'(2'),5'-bisphosphate nucleotidase CysQ [Methylococcaceae bacterium]|jgi:3'(2'), 5'-bisphosphate nucleotidase|nr:3'(2'),5'-bisphosphate nucleotidase CysQ [Methylococcaceae bacterium]
MVVYGSEFRVGVKDDQSPLTGADLASHDYLMGALELLNPQYPVVSEECAVDADEATESRETYWLIDPLDGTQEFIRRNGEFTVNIALIHRHRPVLGVVYAPALGVTYFASEGCGAFRQEGEAEPTPIHVTATATETPRVVASRSHGSTELELYLARLGKHERVAVGSSLKFCLVAEGRADIYPRMGPTSEWDTAAAQCVVEQAGGAVVDLDGLPLRYNAGPSILNPFFLAFGDKSRDWTRYARGIVG